ncbi:MAG: hypothetical protein HEQ13_17400 [Dolichospermum sp. DEX189]|nr:hypothetical protein [Dolichospermum sp. DEX189]
MARQKALMQEARVKRVWAILHFFTQFGFIVFTYLQSLGGKGSNHNPGDCFISLRSIWLTPRNAYVMTVCN